MRERTLFWIGMLVLSALAVRGAWIAPYIPTNDGPQHVLSAHIENHYSDPDQPFYAATLEPAPQFAYKGFSAIYGPLESALGWRDGLRVAIAVMVVGFAWAFAYAVFAFDPRRRFVAYAGFALAWMWPLYMGFFAHVVGTTIGLCVIAYAMRAGPLDTKRTAVIAAGLLVQSVAHAFTAALTWSILAVLLVAAAERAQRGRVVVRAAIVGLPPFAMLLAAARFQSGIYAPSQNIALAERFAVLPRILAPGPPLRAWLLLALVVALAVLTLRRIRKLGNRDRAAFAIGAAMLVLAGLLPRDVHNWQFFSPRLVPIGAALVLVAAPFEQLRAPIAGGASFAIAAVSLMVSAHLNASLAEGCEGALSGLDAPVKRRLISLPIVLDAYCAVPASPTRSAVPYLAPLGQIGALYAAAQGGTTPYLFIGSPAVHAFTNRKDASLPVYVPDEDVLRTKVQTPRFRSDAAFRSTTVREQLWFGMEYEGVIVVGADPAIVALVREDGFQTDFARGSLVLAHFTPCAFDVDFEPPPAGGISVEAFLPRGVAPPVRLRAVPETPARFHVVGSPCGETSVAISTSDGARCANADATGRLDVAIPREGTTLRCEGLVR
ncbi:MAG TPA: hypothetical protein VIF62_06070 [Labilithrix sp.]